jgi:hypothetical protein
MESSCFPKPFTACPPLFSYSGRITLIWSHLVAAKDRDQGGDDLRQVPVQGHVAGGQDEGRRLGVDCWRRQGPGGGGRRQRRFRQAHQRAAQEGGTRAPGASCRRCREEGRTEETGCPRRRHRARVPILLPLPGTAAGDRRLRVPRHRVHVRVPVPVIQHLLHNVEMHVP